MNKKIIFICLITSTISMRNNSFEKDNEINSSKNAKLNEIYPEIIQQEINNSVIESFISSKNRESDSKILSFESSFLEKKKKFNQKKNTCFYETRIKPVDYKISNNIRTEKSDKDYKGQKIILEVELEITEKLISEDGLEKKNTYTEKQKIESSIINLKKKGNHVEANNYLIIINKKDIYWKKHEKKKPKMYEKFFKDVEKKNKITDINDLNDIYADYSYRLNTMEGLYQNSGKNFVLYKIDKIPCDVSLPIVKLVNSFVTVNVKQVESSGVCFSSKKFQYFLGVSFEFDISFFNKTHLKEGGKYFRDLYVRKREFFEKFKSLPFKSQIV